ncbi:MAG: FAD/NAD(P)-binding oxidoreductase [Gammaproteobacteria bacterium]|nr:FAD/NAD(P)-binding oxidoreductase [Gammaproteobacteria bacterium]
MRTAAQFDLIVIGAGPAGLAAAGTAAAAGANVLLVDEQATPGGQIYRNMAQADDARLAILGDDYAAGLRLLAAVEEPGVQYQPNAMVWQVTAPLDEPTSDGPTRGESTREVFYSVAGKAYRAAAAQVVLATGALERPMPIPGWTLPGVMNAGAAQILLKSGLQPDGDVVLAGSGPLLFLLATQLHRAGTTVRALLDTTPPSNWLQAAPHFFSALAAPDYLWKGRELYRDLARTGIPHLRRVEALSVVERDGRAGGIECLHNGKPVTIAADLTLIHQGVVPNVQLSRSLRLQHVWDDAGRAWIPETSADGQSSLRGIAIAGDGAGINGAQAAAFHGELAALKALQASGHDVAKSRIADIARAHRRHTAPRKLIDRLYEPAPEFRTPPDDVIVCRCEEVTAGTLRQFARDGCQGPNQAKAFGRCGMGPCQGRYCGLTVSEVMADAHGVQPSDIGYYRLRPPIKPVTLGEVAGLDDNEVAPSARVV